MLKYANPESIGKPFSRYSHVVTAPENSRWVHIAGQVGAARDGSIPEGFEAQARLAWANALHAIRAAGMGLDDIVKTNVFLTRREDIATSRAIREEALQGRAPAATLLIVSGLAIPSLLLEVEVIAAQAVAPARAAAPRAKAKARPKAKAKSKAKAKAKSKAKAKTKSKAKAKAKGRPKAKAKRR
jgi:enamine deaminase RidA (YjgF/YER057c/UK114 family)